MSDSEHSFFDLNDEDDFKPRVRPHLTFWQRLKRRLSLWGGSYTWPDGTIELDIDEKAGVDVFLDSEEILDAKFNPYFRKQSIKEIRGTWFFFGIVAGVLFCKFFGIPF